MLRCKLLHILMIVDAELRLELAEAQEGYERIKSVENQKLQKKEVGDPGTFTLYNHHRTENVEVVEPVVQSHLSRDMIRHGRCLTTLARVFDEPFVLIRDFFHWEDANTALLPKKCAAGNRISIFNAEAGSCATPSRLSVQYYA